MKINQCTQIVCFLALLTGLISCSDQTITDAYEAYDSREYEKAFPVIKALAEQADPKAQTYLAAMYQAGLGVKRDSQVAYKWYEKAAYQNYAPAQYNLGIMLREGNGVEPDPIKAYGWLHKAREMGHAKADAQLDTVDFNLIPNQTLQAREWVEGELKKGQPDSE